MVKTLPKIFSLAIFGRLVYSSAHDWPQTDKVTDKDKDTDKATDKATDKDTDKDTDENHGQNPSENALSGDFWKARV